MTTLKEIRECTYEGNDHMLLLVYALKQDEPTYAYLEKCIAEVNGDIPSSWLQGQLRGNSIIHNFYKFGVLKRGAPHEMSDILKHLINPVGRKLSCVFNGVRVEDFEFNRGDFRLKSIYTPDNSRICICFYDVAYAVSWILQLNPKGKFYLNWVDGENHPMEFKRLRGFDHEEYDISDVGNFLSTRVLQGLGAYEMFVETAS